MPKLLSGRRILVVEDEYVAAVELARMIAKLGGEVVGPVGRLSQAETLARGESIHAAVLDVKLNGENSLNLVEELLARGVPLVLATGYESDMLPKRFAGVPRLSKPYREADLAEVARRHLRTVTASPAHQLLVWMRTASRGRLLIGRIEASVLTSIALPSGREICRA